MAGAERLSRAEMVSFLVQCIGSHADGAPVLPGPSDQCTAPLQTISDPVLWRKHDWPDQRVPGQLPLGQQASDAVLDPRHSLPVIVQTFDHGVAGYSFNVFEPKDDGGDAATVLDDAAWIFFTKDGENGDQWFAGGRCRTDPRAEARRQGWLLFDAETPRGAWRERIARYRMVRSPAECPADFRESLTRYRRDAIEVPFMIVDATKKIERRRFLVDTIVSEHTGGRDLSSARALERFYFGRGVGKYRWEAWQKVAVSRFPNAAEIAQTFASTGRCPPLPYSEPPGQGWALIECRMWTNLVHQATPWTASSFDWPGSALDSLEAP
jgi:hypothetical protein